MHPLECERWTSPSMRVGLSVLTAHEQWKKSLSLVLNVCLETFLFCCFLALKSSLTMKKTSGMQNQEGNTGEENFQDEKMKLVAAETSEAVFQKQPWQNKDSDVLRGACSWKPGGSKTGWSYGETERAKTCRKCKGQPVSQTAAAEGNLRAPDVYSCNQHWEGKTAKRSCFSECCGKEWIQDTSRHLANKRTTDTGQVLSKGHETPEITVITVSPQKLVFLRLIFLCICL